MNTKLIATLMAAATAGSVMAETGTLFADTIPSNYAVLWTDPVDTEYTGSGQFVGRFQETGSAAQTPIIFYCIGLHDLIYLGTSWSVQTETVDNEAGYLVDHFAATATDGDHQAALQYAIWKVITGGTDPLDILNGSFHIDSYQDANVVTYADAYLAAGYGHTETAIAYMPTGSYGQAQISPTPSPAAALPFLIGFAARRRRAKLA